MGTGDRPATSRGLTWIAIGVGLLAPLALCLTHVVRYPTLSPIDEMLHIDGVDRGRDLRVIHDGDQVEEPALRAAACRGIDSTGRFAECDQPTIAPDAFPGAGYNQQSQHPPGFYLVTAAVSRVVEIIPGIEDRLIAYRLTSVLWLLAGLVVLGLALGALGASPVAISAALTLCGTPMTVVHLSTTVNNDASAIFAGSLVVLGVIKVGASRWPAWSLAVVGAAALALKGTFVLALAAGLIVLLIDLALGRSTTKRTLVGSAWLLGGGAASGGAFLLLRNSWARRPLIEVYEYAQIWHRPAMPWAELFSPEFGFPLIDAIFGHRIGGDLSHALTSATTFLFATGAIATTVLLRRSVAGAIGLAGLVGCLLANPVAVTLNYASLEMWIPLLHRYALCVLPFMTVPLAVAATRWRGATVGLVGLASLSTMATAIAFLQI